MKWALFLQMLAAVWSLGHTQTVDTEETAVEEEHVELFTTPTSKLAAATSDFGYNLFRALAAKDSASNLFLAPTSISEALTQLSMGASEQAQRQLYRALRYHNLLDPQLHNTLRDLLVAIKGPEKGLKTAARICLSRRLRPKQDFFAVVERQYGVRPQTLTGGAKDLKDINNWVKQQTGNTIARFLAKALPRNAGVNLVGAGFFKGKWVTRFGQSGAMEEFQLDGGATVRVPMMHQDNYPMKMGIDSDLDCTIGQIQMHDDVSMFVFLPNNLISNMSLLEESLTAEFVQDLAMTLQPTQVSLKMPALKVNYFKDLLPVLSDLGLSDWLAETNLVGVSAQPAKLTSVNHRVVMEIAPEGTQYPGSGTTGSHLLFHVNRPFLYLVRDEISGALLVMGRVLNPKDLRK
ncbi:pigment epithelium-derived factor [Gadus chalcogrammus]|uniref:pigment epithelium-derived factor n=1 Tax=Gadus chalcogrammus TaxID=1042646 RepID=UPI0024C31180|nr:pigment epithelium-derived factor [Gadus chalcogrammus]